eukprot:16010711-Heterocapsa_arctica.AAC.1
MSVKHSQSEVENVNQKSTVSIRRRECQSEVDYSDERRGEEQQLPCPLRSVANHKSRMKSLSNYILVSSEFRECQSEVEGD